MYKNEEFALACRSHYEEQGLIVDASNGEFAHCPYPRGMGEIGYYLLWEHHQIQGLLQSADLDRRCFWVGDAKKWLLTTDFFPQDFFYLWDLYDRYAGTHGKATYINPETGKGELLTPEEALLKKWDHACKGKSVYNNPETGDAFAATKDHALKEGLIHISSNKPLYVNRETGEIKRLLKSEAEALGWDLLQSGKSLYECPITGNKKWMLPAEAKEKGWTHVNQRKAPYRDPSSQVVQYLTPEQATELGWAHVTKGMATYKDPETGDLIHMSIQEAQDRGYSHCNSKAVTVMFKDGRSQSFHSIGDAAKYLNANECTINSWVFKGVKPRPSWNIESIHLGIRAPCRV